MLDNYRDLIDELLGTPGELRRAIESATVVPAAALRLLGELRDRDDAVLRRLQTMTRTTNAVLPAESAAPSEAAVSAAEVLAAFDTARGELVSLLMNLTLRDWERTAVDAAGETVVVSEEVERHVDFDESHVARIRSALAA